MLGDRHRDADDVGLLEGVGADGRARDLAGDRDDRDRVHVGVGDRGHQVGRTRAGGGHADADLAGGLRVALGGVPAALLVADQDVADGRGVEQRVVGRQDRAARDAEDDLRPDALERADQGLRTRHRGAGGAAAGIGHLRGSLCLCVVAAGSLRAEGCWCLVPGGPPDTRRPLVREGTEGSARRRGCGISSGRRAGRLRGGDAPAQRAPPRSPCQTWWDGRPSTRDGQPVTAPCAAEPTSLAYLPSTPVV